jgi:hypothetical protein
MKRFLLLSTFAFALFTFSLAQQYGWVDYRSKIPYFPGDTVVKGNSRYIAQFHDVFFIDDNEGWVTTENGAAFDAVILHTIDGGETWELQSQGLITNFLRGVLFTFTSNGYVVGNGQTLLKYGEITS